MSEEPKIPMDLVDGDYYRNVNPWHVRDGKWGGFGECHWRRAFDFGFNKGDVVEWEYLNREPRWHRIWIDGDQSWRELTAEEINRLPMLKRPVSPTFDRSFGFPVIQMSKEKAGSLADLMTQPLLQVIEQAPVIKNFYGPKS